MSKVSGIITMECEGGNTMVDKEMLEAMAALIKPITDRLDTMDKRFDKMDGRLDTMDERFDRLSKTCWKLKKKADKPASLSNIWTTISA